jgi:hypothetical protein
VEGLGIEDILDEDAGADEVAEADDANEVDGDGWPRRGEI